VRKLTVKTTIYVSTIDDSQLGTDRAAQTAEARAQISEQLKDFQSMYLALQKVVQDVGFRVQGMYLALHKVYLALKTDSEHVSGLAKGGAGCRV